MSDDVIERLSREQYEAWLKEGDSYGTFDMLKAFCERPKKIEAWAVADKNGEINFISKDRNTAIAGCDCEGGRVVRLIEADSQNHKEGGC